MSETAQSSIPGLRGVDHIGFTVPDMEEAESFLVDVLGCQRIYELASKSSDGDWMQTALGVHPRTTIRDIRFYRLGNGANFEVFQYDSADGQRSQPRNSDIGGHHVALYVDDLDEAIAYLRFRQVDVMGEATASRQGAEGQRWIYFRSPWGMQFELVSFPGGKAYENAGGPVLWHPAYPAR